MPRKRPPEPESTAAPIADPLAEVADLSRQRTAEAAARLQDLGGSPDRAVSKAARKALYALKQAGIILPDAPHTPVASPPAGPAPIADRAFLTNPDGNGSQMLLF